MTNRTMTINGKAAFVGAALLIALTVGGTGLAYASGGADGGTFNCNYDGVPGWGTVTSSYNHPTKAHWATAIGRGRSTVNKPAGQTATASVSRATYGNQCLYGTR